MTTSAISKVAREAKRRGLSIAAVIREALDQTRVDAEVQRTAIYAILAAEPMPVPADSAELRHEVEAARDPLQR